MFRFILALLLIVALASVSSACTVATVAGCAAPQASFTPSCGQAFAPAYAPGPIVAYAPAPVFFQPAHVVLQQEVRLKERRQKRFQRNVQVQRNVIRHR